MVATLEEAGELFARTGVTPQDIDILIVTVSTITAASSHASAIANHYKMKESVKTFDLSGIGCSASVLAVDMSKDLLLVIPGSYALILSTATTEPSCSLTSSSELAAPPCFGQTWPPTTRLTIASL
ncbi:hypothetical protein SUGI_0910750 [Cryptomeria japonica]|nr:hypothetical protein SUGI_0910750 [Cryptomeria japonica]